MSVAVGVLALQGDVDLHCAALSGLNADVRVVRKPDQLSGLSALVMPGGESTALLRLMEPLNWLSAIEAFHQSGGALFGTCAGLILLARSVAPTQASLGLLDIHVDRNAYGRQLDSHVVSGWCDVIISPSQSCEMVFIRAPKISHCASGVHVLATCHESPVMVQQGRVIGACFHPEMSASTDVYRYILSQWA